MLMPFCDRAALYVRASTEHQNYSTDHQEAVLQEYATEHSFRITSIYRDKGRSGLTLDGRTGLLQLLTDIQSGRADFNVVLVYDVSRWGRFQDVDESAYYEYACRRAGIAVAYCAEPFTNDGSPLATVLKGLKRAMAAEYSRELSAKVFRAQCRLTEAGFKQGGTAGYGLRRIAVSAAGQAKSVLGPGERKNMPTDRVTYTLGPENEIEVVKRIYEMYLIECVSDTGIARRLNEEGIENQFGRQWSPFHVKQILTNDKYAGTLVFNRSTRRLRSSRRPNTPATWVRLEDAFDAIVSREKLAEARAERQRRRKQWSNDEMLDALRDIFVEHGKVTLDLINSSGGPSVKSYAFRFNGITSAMGLAGVSWPSMSRSTITRYRMRCITRDMTIELERCATAARAQVKRLSPRTFLLNGVTVRLLCTRCRFERSHPCWKVTLVHVPAVDFVIWVRADQTNERIERIYLIPIADFPTHIYIWPSRRTLPKYEQYAHSSLAAIFGL
ncbi:recombinase family protein [Telluria aromaticivorans]|uniref:Recombinase family protein n=1 Tax=Telluria aromaticivorans TaxID=2725995 RepID=A0A7Y2K2Q4_9BURK|nr:recombinase family protein [Telluria aromaticivorans]NNG25550.1 recombinase family protein [Telluria aromaticivorans]